MKTQKHYSERRNRLRIVGLAGFGMGLLLVPGSVFADHVVVGVTTPRLAVRVAPRYETVARTVTIPAVYEERSRQVWREPVYAERQVLVDLPAEVITREAPRHDAFGRLIGYVWVEEIIRPARQVWRTERLLVEPGRYETIVERVLVRPAYTRVVHERVLAAPFGRAHPRHVRVHEGRPRGHVVRTHAGLLNTARHRPGLRVAYGVGR